MAEIEKLAHKRNETIVFSPSEESALKLRKV